MKLIPKFFLIFLAGLSCLTAQSRPVYYGSPFKGDTLRILAVMADFQPDKYDATIGTGKFGSHYTKNYQDTIIDPLPHNKAYFDDHLEFASNYFKKVSRGKLNVKFTTLPDVITLSKMMRFYSPPYKSKDFTLLGDMSKETWELAHQKYPSFNFQDYDLFIIFHAGVSNSLNTGSYEINRNLPAIYLGEKAFKTIYGSTFSGLVTTSSGPIMKNSIIMPETESREITAIDESIALMQISINGELVSNIASFLGLPDLYNTDTGISAIGRFGLMDGQAMVANLGIFPPELSAWEKIFMGWDTPVITGIKDIKASVSARTAAAAGDTTILKIPINDYEYYLIENRQQDALKDNVKITYRKSGQLLSYTLPVDAVNGFTFLESNIKGGVVTDVDEFDAAVPGNGIVIWHIDEKVIEQNFESGGINNNNLRKGISLVEADGITDIGEIVKTVFGDVIGDGTADDFWFSGNTSKYYKNKFSDDTKPSAKANNGANSFITLQNFSVSGPKMSFNLSFGGNILSKFVYNINLVPTLKSFISFKSGNMLNTLMSDGSNLYEFTQTGFNDKTFSNYCSFNPLVFQSGDTTKIAFTNQTDIAFFNSLSLKLVTLNSSKTITSNPVLYNTTSIKNDILFGTSGGEVVGLINKNVLAPRLSGSVIKINCADSYFSALSETGFVDNTGAQVSIANKVLYSALTKDKLGNFTTVVLSEGNRFYVISGGQIISEFKINESSEIKKFILSDVENKGENNIIFTTGSNLYAINQKGVVVDNYPYSLPTGITFQPEVLSFNYDSDKAADLVTYTSAGDIYFINGKTARQIRELTLSTGTKVILSNLHPIYNESNLSGDNLGLTVLTESKILYTWDLQIPASKRIWSSEFGDYSNSSFVPAAANDVVYEKLLPEGKIYNWPNPVYGTETNIRFVVNENSAVNIKVFDMGGQIAAEFNKETKANIDTEVVFNVSGIKSGVYFARVEAVSAGGKTENKIIKIVVIK